MTTPLFFSMACTAALCFSGMLSLCLAMGRHYEQVTGKRSPTPLQQWTFRAIGSALLIASLWTCITGLGATVGFVAWWGFLTLGAVLVVVALPYFPRLMACAAVVCGISAAFAVALG